MDLFDVFAFVVFGVLIAVAVLIVVGLGSLPDRIAHERGHPQAAAVNVASWLGIATLGILWPLALIWAFLKPRTSGSDLLTRVDAMEAALKKFREEKQA